LISREINVHVITLRLVLIVTHFQCLENVVFF